MKRFFIGAIALGAVVAAVVAATGAVKASRTPVAETSDRQLTANQKGTQRLAAAHAKLGRALDDLRIAQESGGDAGEIKRLRAVSTQCKKELKRAYEVSAGDFLAASERNDADGCYNLGMCYLLGNGTAKDEVKAYKLFEQAVSIDAEHASALCRLGECLRDGVGCEQNAEEAMKLFARSAEISAKRAERRGELMAKHLGLQAETNRLVQAGMGEGEEAEARQAELARLTQAVDAALAERIKHANEASDEYDGARGELDYGLALIAEGLKEDSSGCTPSVSNGLEYVRRAAYKRMPEAMDRYAGCLMDGTGFARPASDRYRALDAEDVAADEAAAAQRRIEAVKWWYHAANDHQLPSAMVNLANCFRDGKGVGVFKEGRLEEEKRPRAAIYWYYRAAMDYDDVTAMWELAKCCEEGLGGLDYYGGPEKRHFNANWWRTRSRATEGDRLARIWLSGHEPHLFDQLNLLPAE